MSSTSDQITAEHVLDSHERERASAEPGLVLVHHPGGAAPSSACFHGEPMVLGREMPARLPIHDAGVSRRHTRVAVRGGRLCVTDLGSRNGTFVDGRRVEEASLDPWPRVIRIGGCLLVPVQDMTPFTIAWPAARGARVVGPGLARALAAIERAARHGEPVLITGESGTGKELAAQHYHQATGRKGPFLAVNCATIPPGLAERLLFGARRGAYSGADENARGYVQEADGGTLFLDEIADLDPLVQPKLLRLLEEREVMELGGTRPRKVDLRVCAATHKSLRGEVDRGRFREDLYFRIGKPEVRLPSLRERPEEVAGLVSLALREVAPDLSPARSLVEACLLRRWRGNVRELLLEARHAARGALAAGRRTVEAADLAEPVAADAAAGRADPAPRTEDEVLATLRALQGNVTGAARQLGWHRTQLRRWLERRNLRAADLLAKADPPGGEPAC